MGNNILDAPAPDSYSASDAACDYLEHAALRDVDTIAVLTAVLDDSATHAGAKYSLCVGVAAGVQHWKRFSQGWHERLSEFGVSDFHARRFYARDRAGSRVDIYRGWDDDKARRFVGAMLALFGTMKARVIGCAVETEAFLALSHEERAFWTGQETYDHGRRVGTGAPSKPFLMAFTDAVVQAVEYGGESVKVGVVLDQAEPFIAQATVICHQLGRLTEPSGLVTGLSWAPRAEFEPLQLADLAAWLWNRYLTSTLTGEQMFALQALAKKGNSIVRIDATQLLDLRRRAARIFGPRYPWSEATEGSVDRRLSR